MKLIEGFLNDEAKQQVKILIFGTDGVGKTYLAHTLDIKDDSRLAYINADSGSLTFKKLVNPTTNQPRNFRIFKAPNGLWTEELFNQTYDRLVELATNGEIDYIFVDGLNMIGASVFKEEKANAGTKQGNINTQKAYGELADFSRDWCMRIRDINNVTVIMLTHESIEPNETTGETIYRPDFPGAKIKNELTRWFDLIGHLGWRKDADGVKKRYLLCNPEFDPSYRVKDRSGVLPDLIGPDPKYDPNGPSLAFVLDTIQQAGFAIKNDQPRMIMESELNALPAFLKEHSVTKEKLASLVNGRSIRDFNINELNQLKDAIKEKK